MQDQVSVKSREADPFSSVRTERDKPSFASESLHDIRPRLVEPPALDQERIVILRNGVEHDISLAGYGHSDLLRLLEAMDGTRSVAQLEALASSIGSEGVGMIVHALDKQGFLDDHRLIAARTGLDVLLELEDLTNHLLYRTLYRNIFWTKCQSAQTADDVPLNVMRGLVIENYHFLFRESYFDAPVLSYVGNTNVRLAMNRFYAEEYGHDEILMKALNFIGLSREELADSMPLPQTMALCNALAFWSNNDPLFFFLTLGILEGKDLKHDSFIETAERLGLDRGFIGPVRTHSDINLKGGHGNLTREIFSHIPVIDDPTVRRMRAQTSLFIELYDAFYTGVWEHYSTAPTLLRCVSEL